eukprot:601576-Rhodomonas_salina.2
MSYTRIPVRRRSRQYQVMVMSGTDVKYGATRMAGTGAYGRRSTGLQVPTRYYYYWILNAYMLSDTVYFYANSWIEFSTGDSMIVR